MSRKKWPDEAPVFDDSGLYGPGAVFIGTGIYKRYLAIVGINLNGYPYCTRYVGHGDIDSDLKPLTPAARDMLEIARGDA